MVTGVQTCALPIWGLCGTVGLPLLVAGSIWLAVRKSSNKKALLAQVASSGSTGPGQGSWPTP